MTEPRYFAQSLIDPALTRDVARLRAERGPLGLDLPEAASQGHPVEAPHFGVTIWGYRESMSTEQAQRMEDDRRFWDRVRASDLRLYEIDGRWHLVAHEPVALADQVLEDGWGDQA